MSREADILLAMRTAIRGVSGWQCSSRPVHLLEMRDRSGWVWPVSRQRSSAGANSRLTLEVLVCLRSKLISETGDDTAAERVLDDISAVYDAIAAHADLKTGGDLALVEFLRGPVDIVGEAVKDAGYAAGGLFVCRAIWDQAYTGL